MLGLPERPGGGGADKGGQSGARALLDAMANDQPHLARFLLDALDGRLVNACTEGNAGGAHTPLPAAALLPEPEARARFLELLLQRGAAVDGRDSWGRTALSHACERGHLDAVRRLVQAGANPELPDAWGNTPLLYAAAAGQAPAAAFLVRAFKRLGGLDVGRVNRAGNSALGVARALGHVQCVRALTGGKGEDPRPDSEGEGLALFPGCKGVMRSGSQGQEQGKGMQHSCKGEGKSEGPDPKGEGQGVQPGAKREVQGVRPAITGEGQVVRLGNKGRLSATWTSGRLQSMDSIDEEEGPPPESPCCLPSLPPPRSRSWSLKSGCSSIAAGSHLPPLSDLSPLCVTARDGLPGHLSILLTPLPPPDTRDSSHCQEKVTCSFEHTYYQKRSSLPSTCPLLSPMPPTRAQPPATFTQLGNKLLRRFTFLQFRKPCPPGNGGGTQPGDKPAQGSMTRSETFPLSKDHPQVASKPSIDSSSGAKCEFDFPSHP